MMHFRGLPLPMVASLPLLLLAGAACGQPSTETIKRDTTIFHKYTGEITTKGLRTDTGLVKNGPVAFASRVLGDEGEQVVRKLEFTGAYLLGKRHGPWQFKESQYQATISGVQRTRTTVSLAYLINGSESSFKAEFNAGRPQGKWSYLRNQVRNGRVRTDEEYGSVQFDRGVAIGGMRFQDEHFSVELAIGSNGFLDGRTVIRYKDKDLDEWVREVRTYRDGFLLELTKYMDRMDIPLVDITFEDVSERLSRTDQGPSQGTISEEGFGILFDNGYHGTDARIIEQHRGNAAVDSAIGQFTKYLDRDGGDLSWPAFKLTRRFVYTYPEDDPATRHRLVTVRDSICREIDVMANSAGLRLYEQDADAIRLALAFAEEALKKCATVQRIIQQVDSGEFRYRYRAGYFEEGVPGLNAPDSVVVLGTKKDSLVARFPQKTLVTGPDSLLQHMLAYMDELGHLHRDLQRDAFSRLRTFTEQEKVDSLDRMIYRNELISDTLMQISTGRTRESNIESFWFNDKVRMILKKNQIRDLKVKYISAESLEEKIEHGLEVECYYSIIIEGRSRLRAIADFQSGLDSLFTIFEENPFDTRYFESRVLGNIKEKAGRRLFDHYTNEILQSRTCQEAKSAVQKIERLQGLLTEIARKHDDPEVLQLNRALRRETVPARIERMLGISN